MISVIAVEVIFGFDVAVGSGGTSVNTADGVPVTVTTTASLVSVTSPRSEVARGVQTVTVESSGGKVGIAPQEVNTSAAKLNKMITFLFLIKLSLFGSKVDPLMVTSFI